MLTGSDTILKAPEGQVVEEADAPVSAPPQPGDNRRLLAITDSRGRLRCWDTLRQAGYWRGVIALCSRATPADYLDYLRRRRVDYVAAGEQSIDPRAALEALNARYGATLVRADSGGTPNGALLRAGLVDG